MQEGTMGGHHEKLADVIIQGTGLAASVVGVGVLVHLSTIWADGVAMIADLTYGVTLIAMFICSLLNATVNHPLVRMIDHSVIYLLIAGTYTPFCLLGIGGDRGIRLLAGVWLAAAVGVVLRIVSDRQRKKAAITIYVLMGWCGLFNADVLLQRVHIGALILLAIGGILYTVGAPLHRWSALRYHSAIWHGCVLAAAACHYSAIVLILSTFRDVPVV